MRIIGTLQQEQQASTFSHVLEREGITYQIDADKNVDWGSHEYGNVNYRIWIIDEDQVDKAEQLFQLFQENPSDPKFTASEGYSPRLLIPSTEKIKQVPNKIIEISRSAKIDRIARGQWTLAILLLCVGIFFVEMFTEPSSWPVPSSLPLTPLYASSIKRNLLYDYPLPYQLFNRFVEKNTVEKVLNPEELSPDAANNLAHIINIPYWQGFYDKIVSYIRGTSSSFWPDAPLFEKIREGEVWRLFTPALLHAEIFHILFNMLWLYALGWQLEQKLGVLRYLFFILISGIITNTAQYLMSGSNFLGFSGILCAMITFMAMRQKIAAWEGYQLDHMTKMFIFAFIFGVFAFQIVSFIVEITTGTNISPGIANTAHMSGLLLGAILGRFSLFSWK